MDLWESWIVVSFWLVIALGVLSIRNPLPRHIGWIGIGVTANWAALVWSLILWGPRV